MRNQYINIIKIFRIFYIMNYHKLNDSLKNFVKLKKTYVI